MTKRSFILLIVIIGSGLLIRLMGIGFGLPTKTRTLATYHPDESIHLYSFENIKPAAMNFYPGDALYWGTFHFYLQGALTKLADVTGVVSLGNRDYFIQNLTEADKLYVIGRGISVLFGTAAIFIFFLIGRKLYGHRGGIIAACLAAWAPLTIVTSFYAKPDGVMFFWYLCTVLLSIVAVDTQERRFFVLCGIFLGLATVSKYSGMMAFGFFLILNYVAVFKRKLAFGRNTGNVLIVFVAACVIFLIINPYAVIRSTDFLRYFHGVTVSKTGFPPDIMKGYADYLTGILPSAIGWPVYVFAFSGMILLLTGASSVEIAMLLFVIIYIIRLGPPRGQTVTYCLPMIPFLLLFAVKSVVKLFHTRNGKLLAGVMLAYTLVYSLSYKSLFTGEDPRETASRWIEQNIPADAVIGMSKSDFWTPPVLKQYQPRFKVVTGAAPQKPLTEAILALPDVARAADYMIITSDEYYEYFRYASEYPREAEILDTVMHKEFTEVASFSRSVDLYGIPFYKDYVTLDWMFPNPTVHILKRK